MLPVVNRDRAVAIVASTGMILTWLANAASPRPEPVAPGAAPQASAAPVAAGASDLAFDMERETERLRLRIADAPGPRRSGRDPFRFAERRIAPVPRRVTPTPEYVDAPALMRQPADEPLPFKLIGVAERATADTTVRTAVLSGKADVFIVGVGDQVIGRYTVAVVAADAVELTDATTGQAVRLALK
jgi:hypothetical protein